MTLELYTFFKNKRIVNGIPPILYWRKGNVDMPNRAPVLDSGPRIYVAVKSQDEETKMKMKRV